MTEIKEKNRRKRSVDILSILRYGMLAVLVIYVGLLFWTSDDKDAAFDTVASEIEKVVDTEAMKRAGSQELKRLYGLNEKDYDGVLLYYNQATMNVEEVFVVRAKTKKEAREVLDAAISRRDIQIQNFEGYGAEQVDLLKNAIVKQKGHYVLFVVSPEAAKYEKAFERAL
ncbi:DUF4358 domain-containing protein [Roseburia hominis]